MAGHLSWAPLFHGEERLPMPMHSRKRSPPATRRRALELLVRSPDGMTEAMLRAHGFTVEILVDLVQAGLATAENDRVVAGGRPINVARMRITDAGRHALSGRTTNRSRPIQR